MLQMVSFLILISVIVDFCTTWIMFRSIDGVVHELNEIRKASTTGEQADLEGQVQGQPAPKELISQAVSASIQNPGRHEVPLNVDAAVNLLLKALKDPSK